MNNQPAIYSKVVVFVDFHVTFFLVPSTCSHLGALTAIVMLFLLILTAANAVADMEIVRIRTSTSANNRFLLFFILPLLYNKQCRSVSPDLQIDYNTYGRNAPHTKG